MRAKTGGLVWRKHCKWLATYNIQNTIECISGVFEIFERCPIPLF